MKIDSSNTNTYYIRQNYYGIGVNKETWIVWDGRNTLVLLQSSNKAELTKGQIRIESTCIIQT